MCLDDVVGAEHLEGSKSLPSMKLHVLKPDIVAEFWHTGSALDVAPHPSLVGLCLP